MGLSAVTLLLFLVILYYTRKSADAAVEANRRAQEEMDIRLAPFISVRHLKSGRAEDINGKILLNPHPQTGVIEMNEIPDEGVPRVLIFSIEIKNSGLTAATDLGIGQGFGFDQKQAVSDMRADTDFMPNVWPPGESAEHQFPLPLEDIITCRTDPARPYYVAISVAYKDRLGNGWLVESEWEMKTSRVNAIRQTLPEPYNRPPPDTGDKEQPNQQSSWFARSKEGMLKLFRR